KARELLRLDPEDVGRPLKDLQASYRPAELRAGLDAAFEQGDAVRQAPIRYAGDGDQRTYELRIDPLEAEGALVAASVTFLDITETHVLEEELERSRRELGAAYEELQSTVEELETTNEELQSTNEELETTNEELQSTNEELETMNEELESTNEELETTNDELRMRTAELDEVNAFLETIVGSLGMAVAVLDATQIIRMWNPQAEDLWGVRADEAEGRPLAALDSGLPTDAVRPAIRTALVAQEPAEATVDATNRRGRRVRCVVRCLPLRGAGAEVAGVVLLMDAEAAGGD
ncbi:MAG TPA: PAS domain-containing protein, partial [Baekduia sp.]|nr:PAS domain-containing protein [Baekduia sp.]